MCALPVPRPSPAPPRRDRGPVRGLGPVLGPVLGLVLATVPAAAATLVSARAIPAAGLIGPEDVRLVPGESPGALADPALAIGKEARVSLYPGRPIRAADLGPPALVHRNAVVTLGFRRGGIEILAQGRALDRGGEGDEVRVMNLTSRLIVTGRVMADGSVEVGE
jgi:flagella basal body P-ring formation protein FlgA